MLCAGKRWRSSRRTAHRFSLGLDRPRGEVHEPSPGKPGQGYMKVARHGGVIPASCCDSGDIDLQEFGRIYHTVVLFWQVWAKHEWPGHHAEEICQCGAAHPGHRGTRLSPGVPRGFGCRCIQVGIEVVALDVETVLTRPQHGDTGILARAPAVEFCPQIFGPCNPHCG